MLIAIVIPAIPFLLWDALVTGAHWHFNPLYVSGIKIINLPIEEILFFITVPFACLFTWEMIIRRAKEKQINLNWSSTSSLPGTAGRNIFLLDREAVYRFNFIFYFYCKSC